MNSRGYHRSIGICFGADRRQPCTAVSTNLGTPNQPSKEPKSGKTKQSKMLIAAFKKVMRELEEQRILQQEERLSHRFLERGTQYRHRGKMRNSTKRDRLTR
uniref:Unplaced genomic scaffold supercont1.7, whole genome shotgun sequence n=1 Tax=Cryptococcus bacillisporus CA1280 TaxID=1296109 RepID=A0A0D0TLZ3_CRYGA|nr:hypothetical protein I312_02794 [Cryptococcus bacillisporus CA1280]